MTMTPLLLRLEFSFASITILQRCGDWAVWQCCRPPWRYQNLLHQSTKTAKLEWANIPKGVQTDSMRELQIRDPLSTDPDQPVRKSRFFQTDPFAAGWFPLCVWGKGGRRMPILWWEIFAFMTFFLLFPQIPKNSPRFQVVWREEPGRWGSDTASISQSKNICLWLGWWLSRMRTISY